MFARNISIGGILRTQRRSLQSTSFTCGFRSNAFKNATSSSRIIKRNIFLGLKKKVTSTSALGDLLYKGNIVLPLRLIMRLKLLHAASMIGLCAGYLAGYVSYDLGHDCFLLITVGGVFLAISTPFSLAYVARVYLDRQTQMVTFSTLSFWGSRINRRIKLSEIVPSYEVFQKDGRNLKYSIRLETTNGKNNFFFFLPFSTIVKQDDFLCVLAGRLDPSMPTAVEQKKYTTNNRKEV